MLQILKKYWDYDGFRGIQEQIINEIMCGRDVLGLMPTGGGKSITFQVPALALDGVCIVISPLIALMKDQVENLRKRNIRAAAIYSGMSHNKILETLENAVYGGVKILYVSPERLSSELFQAKLKHMKVSFFTIDEAHCICQWGYDFRPSYLKIAEIRQIHLNAPVLALTATATPAVVKDIQEKLQFRSLNSLSMSFSRSNLSYIVQHTDDKLQALIEILQHNEGSAIVYVSTRDKTSEVAELLRKIGISAEGYNAGLTAMHRDVRQQKWTADRTRVIVATNAFGMGIDKPDVRLVVHLDCPTSIEAYFQEAGRAGRDGKPSKAILLLGRRDTVKLRRKIDMQYPKEQYIQDIYRHLCYFYEVGEGYGEGYSRIFNMDRFCHTYHFFPVTVVSALHILDNAGYINYDDERDSASRVRFIVDRDELYELGEMPAVLNDFMQTLLRRYTGMFTSYVYIMEEELEEQTGLSPQQVYDSLVELSRRGIIRYIPRSKEPMLTFAINRVREEDFFLPDNCYKTLKDAFIQRVEAMIAYIENGTDCRAKQLLAYFGETQAPDCHQCDVCQNSKLNTPLSTLHSQHSTLNTPNSTLHSQHSTLITKKLADGQWHHISELYSSDIPSAELMDCIKAMLQEEKISSKGALLKIK